MQQRAEHSGRGEAVEVDDQRIAAGTATSDADGDVVVGNEATGHTDLPGASALVQDAKDIFAVDAARVDGNGECTAGEVHRIGVGYHSIAGRIDQHRRAFLGVGDAVAIEASDHGRGNARRDEVERGVGLNAHVDPAGGIDEGLAVDAHGIGYATNKVSRWIDGPGIAGARDRSAGHANGLYHLIVAETHDLDIAAALEHGLVELQHDVGRRRDRAAFVGRRGAQQLGRGAVLVINAGAGSGKGAEQVGVAITVEITDAEVGGAEIHHDQILEGRVGPGHGGGESAITEVLGIAPVGAVGADLPEHVGIAIAVEIAKDRALGKGRYRDVAACPESERSVAVVEKQRGRVGSNHVDDVEVAVPFEVDHPVVEVAVGRQRERGERRSTLRHIGEGAVAVVQRIAPAVQVVDSTGLVEDVGGTVAVEVTHDQTRTELRATETGGRCTFEHTVVVAIQVRRAEGYGNTQQVDVTVVVEVGGIVVGAGVGHVDHRNDVAKRRGDVGAVDNGEATTELAGGELPRRTDGVRGLEQNVVTPVAVEIADDHPRQGTCSQYWRVGVGATGKLGGHHRRVTFQLRAQCGGLDRTDTALQRPVAAQDRRPGFVCRRRDVGTGDACQLIEKRLALLRFADLAAVQHQVAVSLERRADAFQRLAVFGEVVAGQPHVAHLHVAVGTVGQQVNGIEAIAALEVVGHLLQAVLGRVEDHHFGVTRQAFEQLADIGHLAIDEHHFLALVVLARAGVGTGSDRRAGLVGGGAVLGGLGGCLGGILSDHADGRIEHDSRLEGHQ